MADVHSSAEPDPGWLNRQRRRKTTLEMVSLVLPVAAAVLFSGWLVAEWSVVLAGLWALFAALLTATYWLWHRGRYPAKVHPPTVDADEPEPRREMAEDAGSIWHPVNLLVLAVGAVAVVAVVLAGLLVSFLIPLLIIVGFGVVSGGSDWGDVGWAILWTFVVALLIEVAVVLPLSKLWGLSMDEDPPDRADFCPPPSGGDDSHA